VSTDRLNISEIFLSLQGEASRAGQPCVMVRLAGCNLRCAWCDSEYAWTGGESMSLEEILAKVVELGCSRVEVTGGEPLTQPASLELLRQLCEAGYETLLETNGSVDISLVDPRVVRIVDFKCPSSGQDDQNLWANVDGLRREDEIKFVIADRTDYEYAVSAIRRFDLLNKCPVLFSPIFGRLHPSELAGWILEDKLDVRLSLQLHKIIWPECERGV